MHHLPPRRRLLAAALALGAVLGFGHGFASLRHHRGAHCARWAEPSEAAASPEGSAAAPDDCDRGRHERHGSGRGHGGPRDR